jgi:glutamate:GABA antiporter
MRIVKAMSNFSGVIGILLPGLIIIFLGFAAVFIWHQPIPTDYSWKALWPDFGSGSNIVFLSTLMFSMAGIELTPTIAGETANPQKTFPRALLISSVLIVGVYIIGTIAVTLMIAPGKIGAASGIMDGIKIITTELHLPYVLTSVALLILISGIGGASVWAVVPVKMLQESCKQGILPETFTRLNKNGMPQNAMFIQASVVTIIILATSFLPTVNSFYEILILMATITYFIPYIFMFTAFLKLRKTHPQKLRPYKIPGGKLLPAITTFVGLGSVLLAICLPFVVPPQDVVRAHATLAYRLELLSGPLIFAVIGYLLFMRYEKKQRLIKL